MNSESVVIAWRGALWSAVMFFECVVILIELYLKLIHLQNAQTNMTKSWPKCTRSCISTILQSKLCVSYDKLAYCLYVNMPIFALNC